MDLGPIEKVPLHAKRRGESVTVEDRADRVQHIDYLVHHLTILLVRLAPAYDNGQLGRAILLPALLPLVLGLVHSHVAGKVSHVYLGVILVN